jgi:hypothetical protein
VRTVGESRVTLGAVDGMEDMAGVSDPLEVWSQFPVAGVPRQLVLVGSIVRESGGFDSGAAKIAYVDGAVDELEALPTGLYEAMCPRLRPSSGGLRLRVVAVHSVIAPFLTDRGDRDLPAWEVTLTHFDGVVTILDPATAAQAWHPEGWSSTTQPGPAVTASIHEDDRTVTVHFTGTPRAYADYPTAEVRESSSAVMVVPIAVDHPGLTGARLAYGERREVTTTLAQPLGARVLLARSGFPVPVTKTA